jgi:hypothetical protein
MVNSGSLLKGSSYKWLALLVVGNTVFAWFAAFIVFQVGTFLKVRQSSTQHSLCSVELITINQFIFFLQTACFTFVCAFAFGTGTPSLLP